MNIALLIAVPVFYFYMAWFFPWERFQFDSTISVSYIFDIIFVALILGFARSKELIGKLYLKNFGIRAAVVWLWGLACIGFIKVSGLNSPFKHVELLLLQILVLAPIVEELVFRGAFFTIFKRSGVKPIVQLSLNSILFSLSHLPAMWTLPKEFNSFIGFQLFYTLILGWLCTKARMKSGGLVEPIILHFIFNLIFYIAVVNFGI